MHRKNFWTYWKKAWARALCWGGFLVISGIAFTANLELGTLLGEETPPPNYGEELPRIPPKDPNEAMEEIFLKPGYRLELAAAEPEVMDPVAMSFDEDGRLFVVEMIDYSEQANDFLGNIKLLEDRDGDGRFETSFNFVEKMSWPTGVICYDGGVFVAAAPDIWYFKDLDGDGVADEKRKVYTGFGRSNVQGLLNSFCWGIDNRIYCQISSSGGSIARPDRPEVEPINANGRDFSFDPHSLEFRLESGGGQHGMSFDDWGQRFTCHNSDHLQLYLYADRYTPFAKFFPLPPSRRSIAEDGPQANVYRISPVEPWRIVRTRLRVANITPGMIEGGGRASGYFTSATGVTIYRGDAFPGEMRELAFVGDVGSNIVHRKELFEQGIGMVGKRIDVESEFIASKDTWFRPVQFANAPDGNLYMADLYREVIEHPMSLPAEIKKHLDLTSGRDRGRIYRVVAEGGTRRSPSKLSGASDSVLVDTLESENGWHRDTASRLIFQRYMAQGSISKSAGPASPSKEIDILTQSLIQLATNGSTPQARLHAMGLLYRCTEERSVLRMGLKDTHPRVREWCIAWTEDQFAELYSSNADLKSQLMELTEDEDSRVRFQLALSLMSSSMNDIDKGDLAYRILRASSEDPYIVAACFNAIGSQSVDLLVKELKRARSRDDWRTLQMLPQVAGKLGTVESLAELDKLFEQEKSSTLDEEMQNRAELAANLVDALQSRFAGVELQTTLNRMPNLNSIREKLLEEARQIAVNNEEPTPSRLKAVQHLMWNVTDADIGLLIGLFRQQDSQELQSAAASSLRRMSSPEVPRQLLASWGGISPRLRSEALDIAFSRTTWIDELVAVAEAGKFNLADLDIARLNSLRNGAKTRTRVEKLLANSTEGSRAEVFAKYRSALTMTGDRVVGKEVFAKSCASCHRVEGVGYEVGPNLASFQFRGGEAILQNIIEPNREVNPQYVSYTVITKEDQIATGMITNESASSVTLTRGDNLSDTIERHEISEMKSSRLSLMPEGLEQQIDLQHMADLLTYLTTLP